MAPPPDGQAPAPTTRADEDDPRAGRRLERALTALCLGLIAGLLALWLPNYLRWPLFLDSETFVILARDWDSGLARPYRDTGCYNLPGHIYLFWIGGKLFGWHRPLVVQLTDVILLASFGAWTLAWSRRCFGRVLPGAFALLALLAFYCNCDFRFTAERTWHSPLFAAASIMAVQAFPGLGGLVASGALMGAALLIRPDIGIWGSGVVAILASRSARAKGPIGASRAVLGWGLAVGLALALGMLPLLWQGLFGDFVRSFRGAVAGETYDASVARTHTAWTILKDIPRYDNLKPYNFAFFLAGLPCLWAAALWRGRAATRGNLGVWLWSGLAFAVVALNVPFYIGYLILPVFLAAFLSLAPTLAALADDLRRGPGAAAALMGLLVLSLVPGLPTYCAPKLAMETYASALTGRRPETAPSFFPYPIPDDRRQGQWTDFCRSVDYLRHQLPPGHGVINAIDPFGDYGGLGMVFASKHRIGGLANALILPSIPDSAFDQLMTATEREARSAVVIASAQIARHDPDGPPTADKLDRWQRRIVRLLREHYRPSARFGELEVWVRKPEGAQPPAPAQLSTRPGGPTVR